MGSRSHRKFAFVEFGTLAAVECVVGATHKILGCVVDVRRHKAGLQKKRASTTTSNREKCMKTEDSCAGRLVLLAIEDIKTEKMKFPPLGLYGRLPKIREPLRARLPRIRTVR
jgi:hypothetical protein